MTSTDERKLLKNALLEVKSEGLRVFINKTSRSGEQCGPNNGFITDGISVVRIQFDLFVKDVLVPVFQWVPDGVCGAGSKTCSKDFGYRGLSRAIFEDSVRLGKLLAERYGARLYKDFDHFLRCTPDFTSQYTEL